MKQRNNWKASVQYIGITNLKKSSRIHNYLRMQFLKFVLCNNQGIVHIINECLCFLEAHLYVPSLTFFPQQVQVNEYSLGIRFPSLIIIFPSPWICNLITLTYKLLFLLQHNTTKFLKLLLILWVLSGDKY